MILRWARLAAPPRRLTLPILSLIATWTLALWLFLPYESPILSFFRFLGVRASGAVRASSLFAATRDDWLFATPPPFPIQLGHDVAFVLKTGYGTRDRVAAQLEALDPLLRSDGQQTFENVFVVADFGGQIPHAGHTVEIHDAIAPVLRYDALGALGAVGAGPEKLLRYKDLAAALRADDTETAGRIAREAGWELDAMKFIPGLDMAYRALPDKQWYVLLDDDTFLVEGSLRAILGHLDPSRPRYLGNAVGDYKGRFGHGGSAVVLSRAAMARLFDENAGAIRLAYQESLAETWGDKLLATALMRAGGVYLDERLSHHFNGERPWMTRVLADRFCAPIASFHGLADPQDMRAVGAVFRSVTTKTADSPPSPFLWSQLWRLYGQPDPAVFVRNPIRLGHDHVGRPDENTVAVADVATAGDCARACEQQQIRGSSGGRSCLAWTWDRDTRECLLAPWMMVGETVGGEEMKSRFSGLNVALVQKLMDECRR